MEGKSSDGFEADINAQGKSLKQLNGLPIESQIKEEDEIQLEVTIRSRNVGEQFAFFYVDIADGAPITF